MHGTEDKLVPCSASRMIHEKAGSGDKTLELYQGLYHEILNELPEDRARVMEDMWRWIKARIG